MVKLCWGDDVSRQLQRKVAVHAEPFEHARVRVETSRGARHPVLRYVPQVWRSKTRALRLQKHVASGSLDFNTARVPESTCRDQPQGPCTWGHTRRFAYPAPSQTQHAAGPSRARRTTRRAHGAVRNSPCPRHTNTMRTASPTLARFRSSKQLDVATVTCNRHTLRQSEACARALLMTQSTRPGGCRGKPSVQLCHRHLVPVIR